MLTSENRNYSKYLANLSLNHSNSKSKLSHQCIFHLRTSYSTLLFTMFHFKLDEVTLLLYTPIMAVRSFWFDILGESMIDTRVGNLAGKDSKLQLWIISVELGCRAFECLDILEKT